MSEAELLETMVERLLGEGVPPGVISRAFQLDLELVKQRQAQVRKAKYGTDDLSEYMEQMQWTAVEEALKTMTSGSVAEKTRFVSAILGKQMAVAARRTPESQRKATEGLLEMMAGMRAGTARPTPPRSRFVAVLGGTDAGPVALADARDPDDQDEVGEAAQAE
jgi:hypothetical protein